MSPYFVASSPAGVGGPDSGTEAGGGDSGCASDAAEPAVGEAPWALAGGAADGDATSAGSETLVHTRVRWRSSPVPCDRAINRRCTPSNVASRRYSSPVSYGNKDEFKWSVITDVSAL